MIHRDDYRSWVAEIELANEVRLLQLAELFKIPPRPVNSPPPTEGNFHRLHALIHKRLKALTRAKVPPSWYPGREAGYPLEISSSGRMRFPDLEGTNHDGRRVQGLAGGGGSIQLGQPFTPLQKPSRFPPYRA